MKVLGLVWDLNVFDSEKYKLSKTSKFLEIRSENQKLQVIEILAKCSKISLVYKGDDSNGI